MDLIDLSTLVFPGTVTRWHYSDIDMDVANAGKLRLKRPPAPGSRVAGLTIYRPTDRAPNSTSDPVMAAMLAGDFTRTMRLIRLGRAHGRDTLFSFDETAGHLYPYRVGAMGEIITRDGEVMTEPQFWGWLRIDPTVECDIYDRHKQQNAAMDLAIGAQLTLLCALADVDADRRRIEVDTIMDITEIAIERAGVRLSYDDTVALRRRIDILHPGAEQVAQALDTIFGPNNLGRGFRQPPAVRQAVFRALSQVARADGQITPDEATFLEQLDRFCI